MAPDQLASQAEPAVAELRSVMDSEDARAASGADADVDELDDNDDGEESKTALSNVVYGLKMTISRLVNQARDNATRFKSIKLK